MGYACPVCDIPQQDGEHLANHLAFTALIHGDDHETWLNETMPEWERTTTAELAATVTKHAEEAEYHAVFEDTTEHAEIPDGEAGYIDSLAEIDDEETRAIIETARNLTEQARSDTDSEDDT